jgi:hypothetical protein
VYALSNIEANSADAAGAPALAAAPTTIHSCAHVCRDKARCAHKVCCKRGLWPPTVVASTIASPVVSEGASAAALNCSKCDALFGSGGAGAHRCVVSADPKATDSIADVKSAPAVTRWPSVVKVFGEQYSDLLKTEVKFASALRAAAVPGTLTLIDSDGASAGSRSVYYAERGQPLRSHERLSGIDFAQLIDTVKAMHAIRWVHRDIRRSNLVRCQNRLYLIDYNAGVPICTPCFASLPR